MSSRFCSLPGWQPSSCSCRRRNRRPCCCSPCSASSISWPAFRRAWRSRRWSINGRFRYSRRNRRNKQVLVRKLAARAGRAAAIALMSRDFQLPGRSAVIACEGMAATSHPLASLAAIEALRAGGNAADAAVTARGMRSIAPATIHAVTVPGAIDAWGAILEAHGKFSLDRALAPTIRYAASGFPVASRVASDWAREVEKLRADAGAARHLLFAGRAPAEGDVVKLPALARTLATIAAKGPRAFYEGPIAQDIVATVAARGSFLAAEDLANHRGEVVVPVATNYRGLDVLELPPNTQGLTALVLLNILERFDLAALDPLGPERFHLALEAARLAYAVRDAHLADAAFMRAAVPALLEKRFAAELASRIDPVRRKPTASAPW